MWAIVSAASLALGASAFGSNTAPGVQIIVKKGSATAFKGVTDGAGKFLTPPLEPGTYQFEVRGPKIVGATRYFLALAGARPLGEAMTNAFGELAMQAEVRHPVSVRGQVRAFRVMRLPAPTAPADGTASSSATTSAFAASSVPAPLMVNRPVASSPETAVSARPLAPQSSTAIGPARRTAASSKEPVESGPTTGLSLARSPVPQPRISGGKRYVWANYLRQQTRPLGPDPRQRPRGEAALVAPPAAPRNSPSVR